MKFRFRLARATSKDKDIPKNKKLILNSNDRLHYQQKAKITAELKKLAYADVHMQTDYVRPLYTMPIFDSSCPCTVTMTVYPPTSRRMDADNLQPTLKAIMDGFTEADLWTDDNHEVVKRTSYQYGGLSDDKYYHLEIDVYEYKEREDD